MGFRLYHDHGPLYSVHDLPAAYAFGQTGDEGLCRALGKTLAAVDALAGENVKVIVTVSADEAELPDSVKKYL